MKYPRTFHFQESPGATDDDKILSSVAPLENKIVVVSEKVDGENTTFTKNSCHARSLNSKDHESRHWVKTLWAKIKHEIPEGFQIVGENVFARHSIGYNELPSYFLCFAMIYNNEFLSWEDTAIWCEILGLDTVPVFYIESFNIKNLEKYIIEPSKLGGYNPNDMKPMKEGFVIRNEGKFSVQDFKINVGKWVRANHVTTSEHWMTQQIIKNNLRGQK